jgi:hypothetical protein
MKVYLVFNRVRYDGDILLGVFATLEAAQKFKKRLGKPRYNELYEIIPTDVQE